MPLLGCKFLFILISDILGAVSGTRFEVTVTGLGDMESAGLGEIPPTLEILLIVKLVC